MKLYSLSLILLASVVNAHGEFPKNPDQRPSLGFDITRTFQEGNNNPYTSFTRADGVTFIDATRVTYSATSYKLDLRVPVHNRVTVNVHGGPETFEFLGDRVSGYSVGGGMRVYFGD